MTIYRWTGEYRPPKKGEWYLYFDLYKPDQATDDFPEDIPEFILDRQEVEPDEEEK